MDCPEQDQEEEKEGILIDNLKATKYLVVEEEEEEEIVPLRQQK